MWQDHLPVEAADRQELVHEAQCPAKAALVGHAGQLVVRRDGQHTPLRALAAVQSSGSSIWAMTLLPMKASRWGEVIFLSFFLLLLSKFCVYSMMVEENP